VSTAWFSTLKVEYTTRAIWSVEQPDSKAPSAIKRIDRFTAFASLDGCIVSVLQRRWFTALQASASS
jgi:hypothetical protein